MDRKRVVGRALAASIAVAVLGACSGGADPEVGVQRGTTTTDASESFTTIVAADAVATTAVAPAPAGGDATLFERPADAVAHLYDAWRNGDRAAAAAVADAEAIDVLFGLAETDLTGSECNERAGATRCFMDGSVHSVIFEVARAADRSYRVTFVSIVNHSAIDESASVVAAPTRAAVGASVHLQGDGFAGEPWNAEDAPLYLVRDAESCALHATAQHTIAVDSNGHLSGDFVIPSTGDCRMTDEQAAVTPGRYQLAYACTACFIGEIEIVA